MILSMQEELRFVLRVGSLFWIRYPSVSIISQYLFFIDDCSKILLLKSAKINVFEFLVRRKWSIDSKKLKIRKNYPDLLMEVGKNTDVALHFIFFFD